MKKYIALAVLLSCTSNLYAENQWRNQTHFGFSNYIIENLQGPKLTIACNANAGDQYDHSVSFLMNHFEYHNTERQAPLSVLLNQDTLITPPATTTNRSDAKQWNKFKDAISTATQIDVLLNSHKVASFYPSTSSIRTVAIEIKGCEAKE